MIEFDSERYQDSAQGRASVRDRWGNEKPRFDEFAHDYDNPIDHKARRERELNRRLKLKANIQACIAQMELICPPKGGAA